MSNEMEHEDGKDAEVDAQCLLDTAVALGNLPPSKLYRGATLPRLRKAHMILGKIIEQENET